MSSDTAHTALTRAHLFACLTLAFIGRDKGTSRLDKTLDDLCAEATEVEVLLRQALTNPSLTFEEAWMIKETEGYQYGEDALEQVRLGWDMRGNQ